MRFSVLTLFPELIDAVVNTSIMGRAIQSGLVEVNAVNIRDYTLNKNKRVDDYTYGGGAGMLMQAQPVNDAYKSLKVPEGTPVVYMTPAGRVFDQSVARELSKHEDIVFLCGHYEGIDERVLEKIVTDRICIGDYVLTGGELPSLICMDAIARLIPGVLGNEESARTESFDDYLLEYPQYSRPDTWEGMEVPEVLLSGNHKRIEEYRLEQSIEVTKKYRPELYEAWAKSHNASGKAYSKKDN